VVLAAPPDRIGEFESAVAVSHLAVRVVPGGDSRSASVAAALAAVGSAVTVVHDAARPLVTAQLIDAVVEELISTEGCDCVLAATPVTDTIKQAGDDRVVEDTIDRSRLWAAQTPQAFRTDALRRGLESADSLAAATDDAMLVEGIGGRVVLCPAPPENLKVTTALDLRVAELLLTELDGGRGPGA